MNDRLMNNDKGFTLIELMVAMTISVILLGAAMYTYNKQDQVLRDENKNLKLRDYARLAMDQLDNNLRMAGAGFPPGSSTAGRPARGVSNADATTITFMANTEGISTNANFDMLSVNDNGFLVPSGSAADFSVGDTVVFFNAEDPDEWNAYPIDNMGTTTISGVNYDTIDWSPSDKNDFTFEPIDDGVAVLLNQYHTYTLAYNAGNQTITESVDGAAAVAIASQVSSLTFSYFDANGTALTTLPLNATDLGNVRRVQIMIIVVDDIDPTVTATLITDVNMRNMGT
jgi:prepilin-type N-terminal cleavage/methylation domain-containing protein